VPRTARASWGFPTCESEPPGSCGRSEFGIHDPLRRPVCGQRRSADQRREPMTNPQERPIRLMLSILGAFGSGPFLGIGLARLLAPGSFVAESIGMFAFPLAFIVGLQAWLGLAIFAAIVGLGRRLLSKQPWRWTTPGVVGVPPGSFVFVPLSVGAGLLAGLVVGLVSDTHALLTVGRRCGSILWRCGLAARTIGVPAVSGARGMTSSEWDLLPIWTCDLRGRKMTAHI
jgi:hypothetical protein